jgi:hypothetical protein
MSGTKHSVPGGVKAVLPVQSGQGRGITQQTIIKTCSNGGFPNPGTSECPGDWCCKQVAATAKLWRSSEVQETVFIEPFGIHLGEVTLCTHDLLGDWDCWDK